MNWWLWQIAAAATAYFISATIAHDKIVGRFRLALAENGWGSAEAAKEDTLNLNCTLFVTRVAERPQGQPPDGMDRIIQVWQQGSFDLLGIPKEGPSELIEIDRDVFEADILPHLDKHEAYRAEFKLRRLRNARALYWLISCARCSGFWLHLLGGAVTTCWFVLTDPSWFNAASHAGVWLLCNAARRIVTLRVG